MKQEKKEKSKAQEIKIKYESKGMIFSVGEKEFYLPVEAANFLFGRGVQIQFEQLQSDQDFGELDSLSNYVLIHRLLRKGLDLSQISRLLKYPQEKVRKFNAINQPFKVHFNRQNYLNETKRQSEIEDNVQEVSRGLITIEEQIKGKAILGKTFVDLKVVKNLQREGLNNKEIAERLKLDKKAFSIFLERNKEYLDVMT